MREGAAQAPSPWLPRPLVLGVLVLSGALLVFYVWAALATDLYRTFIQGIWLTLAGDLKEGLFYRPVASDGLYGGTRYFPLHFMAIAAVWRMGADPLGAAAMVQTIAAGLLLTGVYSAARAFGLRPLTAAVVAGAGFVPYFVHQSLQELRCDVLAAALNIWGVALLLPSVTKIGTTRTGLAGLMFTLAFATKVTSLSVPAAAIVSLALFGEWRRAGTLTGCVAAGAALTLALIHAASEGRALENWTAAMFAGVGADGTLRLFLEGTFLGRLQYSRYLVALGLVTLAALAWALASSSSRATVGGDARRLPPVLGLMGVLFAVSSLALMVTLSSPGAVVANQSVEWIEIALLSLACCGATRPAAGRLVGSTLVLLTLWAAAQDVVQARRMLAETSPAARQRERVRVLDRIEAATGPVLSESALWPALVGRTPVVLDPFMFRVIGAARPEVAADLIARIERREFGLVLLRYDPDEVLQGRPWFERVSLGPDVAASILANYRRDEQLASDVIAYVPR